VARERQYLFCLQVYIFIQNVFSNRKTIEIPQTKWLSIISLFHDQKKPHKIMPISFHISKLPHENIMQSRSTLSLSMLFQKISFVLEDWLLTGIMCMFKDWVVPQMFPHHAILLSDTLNKYNTHSILYFKTTVS
jgi:hypothetical protein